MGARTFFVCIPQHTPAHFAGLQIHGVATSHLYRSLGPKDWRQCAQTCKLFKALLSDQDSYWKRAVPRYMKDSFISIEKGIDYRQLIFQLGNCAMSTW